MGLTVGIVLFPDVEELDFVGPWEVFTMAHGVVEGGGRVVSIAEHSAPLRAAKGLRVLPDHTFSDAPELDVLLVPGGIGTRREVQNPTLIEGLRKLGASCRFVTSVCTGAMLIHEAGFARGKRITTHWAFIEELRARGDAEVMSGVRYVRDGQVVTAAGVSAGIDMALWLVGQLYGIEVARQTRRAMEYDPAPPYLADV